MKHLLFLLLSTFFFFQIQAQEEKQYKVSIIGFYNVENLFDTIVDPDTNKILQEDFTPLGQKNFNSQRYYEKLDNLARVISEMGTELSPDGLAAFGVAEVENRNVLEDLVNHEKLKDRNYQIEHYDSPDKRGIDVGFIYNPKYIKVTNSDHFPLIREDRSYKSRSQLVVSVEMEGEPVHFIVAHWPSRRGGQKKSEPGRVAAAKLGRSLIDSLQNIDENAKVLYMGDLNDDPIDNSVRKHLKSVGSINKVKGDKLFNPMEDLHKKGIGSLAWRDNWNLFDQILLTPSLIDEEHNTFTYHGVKVFNKPYMIQQSGRFKGYPFRTYVGPNYLGGYADHFPVYVYLVKEVK